MKIVFQLFEYCQDSERELQRHTAKLRTLSAESARQREEQVEQDLEIQSSDPTASATAAATTECVPTNDAAELGVPAGYSATVRDGDSDCSVDAGSESGADDSVE